MRSTWSLGSERGISGRLIQILFYRCAIWVELQTMKASPGTVWGKGLSQGSSKGRLLGRGKPVGVGGGQALWQGCVQRVKPRDGRCGSVSMLRAVTLHGLSQVAWRMPMAMGRLIIKCD